MERICEFCAALRPIVFCKADSAFLCLSCDAKVHSANALSNRHFRCLVCESCRGQPAHIRCLDHRMLLCRACDGCLHGNNAKVNRHQRRMVSSFTGSPSAKQFAILCGFDVNQLPFQEQLAGPSTSSISAGSSHPQRTTYKPNEMPGKDGQQSCLIMQQILDLNRLQLNGVVNQSAAIRERGQAHSTSSCVYNTLGGINEGLEDTVMRDSSGPLDDLHALKEDHFLPDPLSHSEYLSSYTSTAGISLVGEPFSQFWPQTLEEPRVSEEIDGLDVFKMPEVDLTFSNFEELLRADQDLSRALLEDISAPHQDCQKPEKMESATKIYSYSYSFSHLSADSSGSDCYDSGYSGELARADPILNPSKDKKKSRLNAKQAQLALRKSKAEPNRRVKGRYAKPEGEESHGTKATRSC